MTYLFPTLWLAICIPTGIGAFRHAWRIRQRDLGPSAQWTTPAIRALSARWFAMLTFNGMGWAYGTALGAQSLAALLQTPHLWDGVMLAAALGLEVLAITSLCLVTTLRTAIQGPLPAPEHPHEPD